MSNMYKLGDICSIGSSKRIHKADYVDEGIPFYRSKEIIELSNGQSITEPLFISDEKYNEIKNRFPVPEKDDILITSVGTIGITYLVKNPNFYFKDGNLTWLRNLDSNIVNVNYLMKWLKSSHFKSQITNNNIGAVQKAITIDYLKQVNIPLPDLSTQKSIAKVLSDLDTKIELNNKINRELEAMAKTLYDYWFVQFDFPANLGDSTLSGVEGYKSSGGKMVYNEELKREIPEGWEVKTFGDYSTVKSGFAFKSTWWQETGIPVVKIKDIQEDYTLNLNDFSFVGRDKVETAKRFKSKAGDVVIAMTGATIGKFAMIPYSDYTILVNQRVGLYDLGDEPFMKLPYLLNSMKQDFFRGKVFQIAGGAAQPNISGEQLDCFPLLKPNNELIDSYNNNFNSTYKRIANNIKQNQQLTALRDWLLPMLMNGQVTVKESQENFQ